MSPRGEAKFIVAYPRIIAIVKKRIKKYNLTAIGADDLQQEALLAAAYAVDNYSPERGNLDGYISTVVANALAMVASEALAQCRQPYKSVQDADGSWRKVPVHHVELEDDVALDDTIGELLDAREAARQSVLRADRAQSAIDSLELGNDAKMLLELKLHTPAELIIMSRNINNGRSKLNAAAITRWLGWTDVQHAKAARELRHKFRYHLGVDDNTYTQVHTPPAPPELFTGAKQREVSR